MSKPIKLKFNDTSLLNILLSELRTDRKSLQKKFYKKYKMSMVELVTNQTEVTKNGHTQDLIYSTPNCFIKTTRYNKVKQIEPIKRKGRK